jgi:hypothetical protein
VFGDVVKKLQMVDVHVVESLVAPDVCPTDLQAASCIHSVI